MNVDIVFLFIIYGISVSSLALSVYAVWTLKETEQQLREYYDRKIKSAWDHYHAKAEEKARIKTVAKNLWNK